MAAKRVILLLGAVLVAGVISLLVPVSTSDGNGGSIGCGNAISADLSSARQANDKGIVANVPILNEIVPHTDFVAQCQSAVSQRRAWSIPLTVIGMLVVAGSFVVGGRVGTTAQGR